MFPAEPTRCATSQCLEGREQWGRDGTVGWAQNMEFYPPQ